MKTKIRIMKKQGKPTIKFREGTLHSQLHIPQDEKIPASKMAAARSGEYGALAAKRANFAKNVLTGGK